MNIYRKSDIPGHLLKWFEPAEIGLEATPDEYVAKLVSVFREVRRVLRDDGTLWLNLGDSYAANRSYQVPSKFMNGEDTNSAQSVNGKGSIVPAGLKSKDLIGIPWRVAFALQADGWYLRQDIVWRKPNPMPESVIDRCTKSHEYIFLLSKNERYYFDHEAIKEPSVTPVRAREKGNGESAVDTKERGYGNHCGNSGKRNRRSVWDVPTKPYKGAHFATFPPDLIEPCVLAGAPVNGVVLDPFGGSGTTAGVAMRNGRHAVLCELSTDYTGLMRDRIGSLCQ